MLKLIDLFLGIFFLLDTSELHAYFVQIFILFN